MDIDLRHSIYKRNGRDGWTLEYREDGKPVQRTLPTKREAESAWDDIKDVRRRGAGLRTAALSFGEYATKWLAALRPHLRPSSLTKYDWTIAHLDEIAMTPLDAITREDVRGLLATKSTLLSRSSVSSIASTLRACLAEAVADGYLKVNPAEGGGSLRKRGVSRDAASGLKVKALDAEQLRALLDAAEVDGHWRDFFYISWALGLRTGEAIALQHRDVDFERQRVRIERTALPQGGVGPTKSAAGWVDLAPGAADILRHRIEASGAWIWVFPGRAGTMGHATVEHAFKRISARAGLPDHLTPHCLRHTFAAMHLQRGTSVYYVQRMLRHSSIQITVDTYGSWLDPGRPELNAAMEAGALGGVGVCAEPGGVDVSKLPVAGAGVAVPGEEP